MKQNRNGIGQIFLLLGIAVMIGIGAFAYQQEKINEQTKAAQGAKLGAVVYTTQLSDTLGTFRNQVNSSTANLNTEVEAVSTTIHGYGNIVTESEPLRVAAGGTNTSTYPTVNQILSAETTTLFPPFNVTPKWKTLIFGGGIISTTTATSISINTTGVDATANYSWTGTHAFNASTSFNSTTSFPGIASKGLLIAGASSTATSLSASTAKTIPVADGTNWTAATIGSLISITNTTGTTNVSPNTTSTLISLTLPSAATTTVYNFTIGFGSDNQPNSTTISFAGTSILSCSVAGGGGGPVHTWTGKIVMEKSTSLEAIQAIHQLDNAVDSTCSINTSRSLDFSSSPIIQVQIHAASATSSISVPFINVFSF